MDVRENAWEFAKYRFGISRDKFDFIWDFASGVLEKSAHGSNNVRVGGALGAIGDDDDPCIVPIMIFVEVDRKIGTSPSHDEIQVLLKQAVKKFGETEQLYRDILAKMSSSSREIALIRLDETESEFATVWSKEGSLGGHTIDKVNFDDLLHRKADYEVFVVEKGEFEADSVGAVSFSGKEADVTAQGYRILVHTLRNGGVAGTAQELNAACWLGKHRWVTRRNDPRLHVANVGRVGAAVAKLNRHLSNAGVGRIVSRRTGKYRFVPTPDYCLIELAPGSSIRGI